jgi:predicted LPLAT superfamily acyltransferase
MKLFGAGSVKAIIPFISLYNIVIQRSMTKKLFFYWKNMIPGKSRFAYFYYILKHYTLFGISILDRFIRPKGDIDVSQKTRIEKVMNQDRGILLLCSHIGGYNLFQYFPLLKDKPLSIVMYAPDESNPLVSQLDNQQFKFIDPAKADDMIFESLNILRNNEMLMIMGDRVPDHSKRKKSFQINDMKMEIPLGPWHLARTAGAVVFCPFIVKTKKDYRVLVKGPIAVEDIEKAAEQYIDHLKEIIQEYPFQWYNFAVDLN